MGRVALARFPFAGRRPDPPANGKKNTARRWQTVFLVVAGEHNIQFLKLQLAHLQYLVFNNENIPMPASYSVSLSDVEADSGGVTEAGTTQRDVVREGVVQIGVTFRVSKKWLNKFSAYKKLASITVGYLDMEIMNIVDTQMYIDGYQVKLVSDTSYGSLWEVSFTLKEF